MLRRALKALVFTIALLLVAPLIALSWLEKRVSASTAVFVTAGQWLSLFPGPPGVWLRAAYYFGTLESCSWEVHVGFGSIFSQRRATMERNASMGAYCVIGHAALGEAVMIASRVSVPSGKRQHVDDTGRFSAVAHFEQVAIGSESWVGEGAVIMANVGRRCIVSAGAVVTRPVADRMLVAGNPAREVRAVDDAFGTPAEDA